MQASQKLASVNIARSREDEYETLLGIKELASKGMAAEVFEEISAIDPNFFAQNPSLLFQLKQVSVALKHFSESRETEGSKHLFMQTDYIYIYDCDHMRTNLPMSP